MAEASRHGSAAGSTLRLLLVPLGTEREACSRVRIYQYLPFLSARGITGHVVPFFPAVPDGYVSPWPSSIGRLADAQYVLRRVLALARIAPRYDVVVVQRVLLPMWLLRILRSRTRSLIFDFDDAIYTTHQGASPSPFALSARFSETVACSDLVIAASPQLAERTAEVQSRVITLPSPVDCRRYQPSTLRRDPSRPPLVGWIGSASTAIYLERLLPLLRRLASDTTGIEVALVGSRLKGNNGAIQLSTWSIDTELEHLARFDIGLMPLTDDAWARGKAGYKLLQYMACGLPSVASPVGVNRRIVLHGETGYLAESLDQWEQAIRRLAADQELRAQMGARARSVVEREYSLERWAPAFCDAIISCARTTT